jgi:hypothetical protein
MAVRRKKIAVVMTHGIGEQYPMETLTSFVEAAWVTNSSAQWEPPAGEEPDDIWFKPDAVTGSNELRRITTRWTKDHGPRVDFFEFYWADLAEGTTVGEVWDWLRTLLIRWPSQVPPGLMGAWLLLWIASAIIALSSLASVLPVPWPNVWWRVGFAALALALGWLMQHVVAPYVGDVARYVRADPRNIAMRKNIRDRGLKLLSEIHDCGAYERIIFVAHSLGTIVAYDLITLSWTMRQKASLLREGDRAFVRLREVEEAAHAFATKGDQARPDFRNARRRFRLELRSGGADGEGAARQRDEEWLISDFITLGSPLTHAAFLLAQDESALREKIARWLFPTDPPQFQKIDAEQQAKIDDRPNPPAPATVTGPPGGLFSFFFDKPGIWSMHHAAPFAAVRWTNIFDKHRCIFQGDIISGPLAAAFGPGISDIDLRALRGQARFFSHTKYWSLKFQGGAQARHIKELQRAINLLDEEEPPA